MLKIFLVGAPRSGTTLLQSILTDAGKLYTLKETHFFRRLHRWRPLRPLDRLRLDPARLDATFAAIEDENGLETGVATAGIRTTGDAVRALDRLLSNEARLQGRQGWLEKTPEHMFFIDEIRAHVPGARFVHILRDGGDVVASLADARAKYPEHWGWVGSTAAMARLYNRYARVTRENSGRADTFVVRYDDLVLKSPAMLSGLAGFLDLAPERLDLEGAASWRPDIVRPDEAWKVRAERGVVDTRGTKFKALFDPSEQDRLRRRLADTADIVSG